MASIGRRGAGGPALRPPSGAPGPGVVIPAPLAACAQWMAIMRHRPAGHADRSGFRIR